MESALMKRVVPLLLLGLAACAPQPTLRPGGEPIMITPDEEGTRSNACRADTYQRLLGIPESQLLRTRILAPVRIIRPNSAVTADFIPGRLNIELDDTGTVTRVYCG